MRLAHLRDHDLPLAVVAGERIAPLGERLGCATADELIAAGPAALQRAREVAVEALESEGATLDGQALAEPLAAPSKIICIGLNYRDHIRETGLDEPSEPLVFAKFASSLAGPGDSIAWPEELTDQVDWEAELAIVIGARLRDVSVERALEGAFGYTAANDVSARDLQFGDGQWVRGKSLDGFCPLGPVVVTADEFGDPARKRLRCHVNGEVVQDASTAEMVFGPAELLSHLSRSFTLEPGDLVLTGTPWGAGGFADPPRFLRAGDIVEVELEGVGVLANPVAGPN